MNPQKDAYGQEVLAYLEGRPSFEIVERDDGHVAPSGGAAAYFADYKDWPTEQKKAIKFAKGACLDVGAGAGRVSLYLQSKGMDVVAIDNSPLAIKVCKKRGVKKAKVLPIEKITQLQPKKFQSIIMFGNNFGLFGGFKKAQRLLKQMHKITTPDARIISENADPYNTTDSDHLFYHQFNKKRGRMPGQLRIRIRFKKYKGDWFDYLLVSPTELKKILAGTGWHIKKLIPSKTFMYYAIIEKDPTSKQ